MPSGGIRMVAVLLAMVSAVNVGADKKPLSSISDTPAPAFQIGFLCPDAFTFVLFILS